MKKSRISHVDEKVLYHKINNTGMGFIFKDMSEERRLEMMSKYNQFDDKNDKIKQLALEVVNRYFKDDITYQEFIELVFKDYPEYKDNYTFNVYLGQYFRRQYSKSLKEREKSNELLRKLVKQYNKRYHKENL